MNLMQIQTRLVELSAEMLTLNNALTHILQGDVDHQAPLVEVADWADGLEAGDRVICTGFNDHARDTQKRCFTVGKEYIVMHRLLDREPEAQLYGIRVMSDDEEEGHDAIGVKFRKVGA